MEPLVVIVGETASGKSALALDLAKNFNGEIICADSWTVYEGFDIGTAKPSEEDQKKIRHHLLNIADPKVGFSAAEFKKQAIKAIEDISARDKLPIMVGGTGLYVDSVLFDYGFLPAGTIEQRIELDKLTLVELIDRTNMAGFDTSGIDMRNKRRLIRLIETHGQRPHKAQMRPNTLVIGLIVPKENLKNRIEERVNTMLAKGLKQEVQRLVAKYGWEAEPMKGIGYREWKDYFEKHQSLEQTRLRIINSTLQLAKKQRTWFKRNNSIHWINDPRQAVDLVTTFLNKKQ